MGLSHKSYSKYIPHGFGEGQRPVTDRCHSGPLWLLISFNLHKNLERSTLFLRFSNENDDLRRASKTP